MLTWPMVISFLAGLLIAAAVLHVVARVLVRREHDRARAAERRAAAAERLAELGTMTGGLAHEIKNPLSTIGLNAQLLAEGLHDSNLEPAERERLTRRLESLAREVERLRGILTDFLQFAGRVHLDSEPKDVRTLVDELVDFFLPQAENAGVRLRASLGDEPAIASVDSSLLKQALLNLMLNGTEAMKNDSRSTAAPHELLLRVENEPGDGDGGDGSVAIHVIDTGPGIDKETLAQVFRPYFSTKAGGTGLGLPTSRRIVEEHGGQLHVHSEPGRGTSFIIRLPSK